MQYHLTIGWLYPLLMSTYGDRGNILVLKKIAEDNKISVTIRKIEADSKISDLDNVDLLFMGGAQDLQQEIVNRDLLSKKGERLAHLVEDGTPGLFICGAYQFLGKYYKDSYGTNIKGLGLFDMYTESRSDHDRLIGNIVVEPTKSLNLESKNYFVGFENHGGRTYLQDRSQVFAKVVVGYGNNGEDKTEGIHYKNSIGTYLHGPILPSNPELAISLISSAIEMKYKKQVSVKFENELSDKARLSILKRLKTSY